MDRLTKLRQQRAEYVKKLRTLHDLAKTEDRALTEEEASTFDLSRSKISDIDKEIAREEELRALEGVTDEPEARISVTKDEEDKKSTKGCFRTLGEQLFAVRDAALPRPVFDTRLTTRAASGLHESSGTDGGFLVQPDFASELLKKAVDAAALAPRCRRIPVEKNGLKMNALDDKSRADGARWGGIQAFWEGEADEFSASRPKFTQLEWKLKKLTGLCYATEEMLEDATALGSIISEGFSQEFAFKIDNAILRGTGSGQPLGILNSPSLISVAKVTGQAAASFVGGNAIAMRARLYSRSRPNAIWFINQDVEAFLPKLNVVGDATKSDILVYMPANGISAEPYDRLFARPIIPIEQASTVGSVGDVVLADLNEYLLIEKGNMKADVSIHVRFLFLESAFRFVLRIDGQPLWPTALTPAQGTNTQSPFVTTAVRA